MTVQLGPLLVEAEDPAAVTRFWEAALGEAACRRYLVIRPQRTAKVVKNRVHVDVYVHDVASLLALGARVLDEYLPERRVTLADVEGNEFCAFIEPDADSGPPARVFAVCTDSDRPEELAAWWAALLGAEIGPGTDGTMRWLYESAGRPELIWKFVRVRDERVVPNRWQWSVTAGFDELVGAGASAAGDLLVDPDGNEVSAPDPVTSAG
ncbi:VOC family protein [Mycobacterium sp. AZCC_0083]|uniref:VOC family protein n=1 Tax=Mycobacterium sp. AZCC_0083 TaxID=2735882 RepID=UPI00161F0224|nr:VOC family protein [Mycobacterium sp. AZCC_0083]MBB5164066.1 hypothetical protein [Mycobacterium sp. AZCC_0083]